MKRAHAILLAASLAACGNDPVVGNIDASVANDAPSVDRPASDLATIPDVPVADVPVTDVPVADVPVADVAMDAGPRCAATQTV